MGALLRGHEAGGQAAGDGVAPQEEGLEPFDVGETYIAVGEALAPWWSCMPVWGTPNSGECC